MYLLPSYRPDLPHAGEITIHQLLTHTAGFDRYWNDAYRAARSDLRSINDYLKLFALGTAPFSAGRTPSLWQYRLRHPWCADRAGERGDIL